MDDRLREALRIGRCGRRLGYVPVASDGEFSGGVERPLRPDFFETIIWSQS